MSAPRRPAAPRRVPLAPTGRRVLLVDDNRDLAETVRELLEHAGHTVRIATSAAAGLATLRTFLPDVVFCDVTLPDMDGYQLARRLRADARLAHVRLVAISGYTGPEERERARQAGFEQHVGKPFEVGDLERAMRDR